MNVQLRKADARETRQRAPMQLSISSLHRGTSWTSGIITGLAFSETLAYVWTSMAFLHHIGEWAVRRCTFCRFRMARFRAGSDLRRPRMSLGSMPFGLLVVTRLRLFNSLTLSGATPTPKDVVSRKGIAVHLAVE